MTKKIFGSIEYFINIIVLALLGAYVANLTLSSTTMNISFSFAQSQLILIILHVVDVFKLLKAVMKKKFIFIFLFVAFFVIANLSFQAGTYKFLLFLPAFAIALYDIEFDKIITVYLFSLGLIVFSAFLSSRFGFSSFYVYAGTDRLRNCWGIGYPTDFASLILFIAIGLWMKKKKFSDLFLLIPALFSLYIAYSVASSRTSIICSILLIISVCLYNLIKVLSKRHEFILLKKFLNILLSSSFLLYAVLTVILVYLFSTNSSIGEKMNQLMSDRLNLTASAVENYGIHPFGSYFKMIGGGMGGAGFVEGYNFIDNSYALMFIRYGWVFFVIVGVLWTYSLVSAIKKNNYKLAIVMSIIALHSLSEHHFPEINYNIFLVMPFVKYSTSTNEKEAISFKESLIENVAIALVIVLISIVTCVYLPSFISYMRTFAIANDLVNVSGSSAKIFYPILYLIIGMVIILVISIKNLLVCILSFDKEKWNSIHSVIIVLCLIFCLVVSQYKNRIFNGKYNEYLNIFAEEEDVINLIKTNKSGMLYSEDAPEYYNRYFGDFSSTISQGTELANTSNITIVTSVDNDSDAFAYFGLKWMEISEKHAIYTNDESVISALTNNGYQLNDYYSKENIVNLATWGARNGIENDENGYIQVKFGENSLDDGDLLSLQNKTYTFRMNIFGITGNVVSSEIPIAKLQVKYFTETNDVIFEQELDPTLDENGNFTFEFQVRSWKISNAYLSLEPLNGYSFWISSVTYKKNY